MKIIKNLAIGLTLLTTTLALAGTPNNLVMTNNWLQVAYKSTTLPQTDTFITVAVQGNITSHTTHLATTQYYANDEFLSGYDQYSGPSRFIVYHTTLGKPNQEICQIDINNKVVNNNDWFSISEKSNQTAFHCHIDGVQLYDGYSYLTLLVY